LPPIFPDSIEQPKTGISSFAKTQKDSIGNNQNNRIEESIGNAVDFWDSYEQGTFGSLLPRPWIGYLFIGRYEEGQKNKSVKITQPLISVDPVFSTTKENWEESIKFNGCSYADRYRIFLDRMIGKKLYDGASFLITNESIANKTQTTKSFTPTSPETHSSKAFSIT